MQHDQDRGCFAMDQRNLLHLNITERKTNKKGRRNKIVDGLYGNDKVG